MFYWQNVFQAFRIDKVLLNNYLLITLNKICLILNSIFNRIFTYTGSLWPVLLPENLSEFLVVFKPNLSNRYILNGIMFLYFVI